MKTLFSFFLILVITFCAGCSTTYMRGDFPDNESFYEDINNSINNKSAKVTLNNDSTFIAEDGVNIKNDTLVFGNTLPIEINIKKDDIADIKYSGDDMSHLSAIIYLKNGTTAKAENISPISGSVTKAILYKKNIINCPVDKVKNISYKNHLVGIASNSGLGLLGGFIIGTAITLSIPDDKAHQDRVYGGLICSPLGFLTGIVWGLIDGYTYIYEF